MKEKLKNAKMRVAMCIILGIIVGLCSCSIAIVLGYTHIRSAGLDNYSVNLLGFSIFDIQRMGTELEGTANNGNMMFIGLIFSMILTMGIEMIVATKSHRREK